jgi:hypothetical protein
MKITVSISPTTAQVSTRIISIVDDGASTERLIGSIAA